MKIRNYQQFCPTVLNFERFRKQIQNHRKFGVEECWTQKVLHNDTELSRVLSKNTEPYNVLDSKVRNLIGSVPWCWTFQGSAKESWTIKSSVSNNTEPGIVLSKDAELLNVFHPKGWTQKVLCHDAEPSKVQQKIVEP